MSEVTLGQIKRIFLTMNRLSNEKVNKAFAYGLSKNKTALEADLKVIAEAEKVGIEFEQERVKLCEIYALKDDKGTYS